MVYFKENNKQAVLSGEVRVQNGCDGLLRTINGQELRTLTIPAILDTLSGIRLRKVGTHWKSNKDWSE